MSSSDVAVESLRVYDTVLTCGSVLLIHEFQPAQVTLPA
jgi:hypothetical protein